MKGYIVSGVLGMVMGVGFQGAANADDLKPLTVGFSLDTKESSLETAWVDFLKSEGESQGKAAGLKIEWIINVANADPARQAANIDDLITRGIDIIMARAFDSGAIGSSIKSAEKAGIPFVTFDRSSTTGTPTTHVRRHSHYQPKQSAEAFATILKKAGIHGSCIE